MDFTIYAVPFFILAMGVELIYGIRRARNTYRVNDAVSSLFLGSLSQARKFITLGVGGYVYQQLALHFSMPQMDPGYWWTWLLATVLYDFCYYWLHRLGHERSILWAAHVAHHQSEDYNLSTALRQTSTGFLFGWIFYLPLFLLGVPAEVVVTVGSLNLIYQFWVHTEHVPKLGRYEWVFVTPSNHRVHHAQNERYLDCNYGGVFILWDRLFGTFQEELDSDPPVYGIRGALHSWNPLRALTHIYADMARDSWHARRWQDKLYVWFARTGWRPADVAESRPRPKTELASFQRYDPSIGPGTRAYAVFQLVAVVVLLAYLQAGFVHSYAQGAVLTLIMLATTVTTAFWLDGREPVLCQWADCLRVVLLAVCLGVINLQRQEAGAFLLLAWAYLLINAVWSAWLSRDPLLVPSQASSR